MAKRYASIGLLFVMCITSTAIGAQDDGYNATSGLWVKAVLQVPGSPVTLTWNMVGADITPSGDQVISGYFYADPNDFAYGSLYNPEVFVKIYIAANGWANIAFNHVTVDAVTVYSVHNNSGTPQQTGTATLSSRLVEHQYTGVEIDTSLQASEGTPVASSNSGYTLTSGLWAKALLQPTTGPVNLIWKEVGADTTPSGDMVVSGYFYASPEDFSYGSVFNPEVFVKVYIASNGWANIAFNHVTVDKIEISSAYNYSGQADHYGTCSLNDRLKEHQYDGVSSIPITSKTVDTSGGVISHPSGLNVEFPKDCLSEATDISIQEVSLPSPLPDGIQAISKAFKISPDGLALNSPAKVTFQPSASNGAEAAENTSDGVFRWDGDKWESMGSFFEDGNLSASTATFSTFVRIEIIYPELWKKFVFLNKGNDPANLMVWTARRYDTTSVPAGSWRGSVSVPDASADYPERSLWLPLGCYEFCYEWMIYNPFEFKREMVHNFEGDAVWQHCLDDQTGLSTGESVWIDTTYGDYDGPCGTPPGDGGQLWQWQASGRGDYQACDVTNTKGSAIPDPTLAEEGLVAVCWDGVTVCNPTFDCAKYGAWCTYKNLSLGTCPAKESTAYIYVSVPVSSEF